MTGDEALEALRNIEMVPHMHPNGADWIECPACWARTNVLGYAHHTPYAVSLELGMKHESDCSLAKAHS